MVKVTAKAYKKLEAYGKGAKGGEIGGLLLGKIGKDEEVTVRDIMLLKQQRSGADFELSEEDMMELTKNASPQILKSIIGWWHSHNNFGCFWSADDSNCFDRLRDLNGSVLGVVISFAEGEIQSKWRFKTFLPNGNPIDIDDITPEIEEKWALFKPRGIMKEITEKVFESTKIECPHCHGTGLVEQDTPIIIEGEEPKDIKNKDGMKVDGDGIIRDLFF